MNCSSLTYAGYVAFPDPHLKTSPTFILLVGCCVPLHPLGVAEHKTTSFSNPCRYCLHYLRSVLFLLVLHYQRSLFNRFVILFFYGSSLCETVL